MLVAAPYSNYEVMNNNGPPRVISEVRKRDIIFATPNVRPKLSGDLLVRCGSEKKWWPRRVTILGGQLHVSGGQGDSAQVALRIPLRRLSLQAGPLQNSIALCKGHSVIITLQTSNERLFDLWVKTIAIELIRQTPLYDIKYLDILTLAECWKKKDDHYEKDLNFNYLTSPGCYTSCGACDRTISSHSNNNDARPQPVEEDYQINKLTCDTVDSPKVPKDSVNIDVEDLIRRCQNVENYVPVKQKLVLFESLCRLGRKVRSTEDVSYKADAGTKRARSLHDLSSLQTHIAVREICKYFENKSDVEDVNKMTRSTTNNNNNYIKRLNSKDGQVGDKTRLRPFQDSLNRVT